VSRIGILPGRLVVARRRRVHGRHFYVLLSFACVLPGCAHPSCPAGEIRIGDRCYQLGDASAGPHESDHASGFDDSGRPPSSVRELDGGRPGDAADLSVSRQLPDSGAPQELTDGATASPSVTPPSKTRLFSAGIDQTCAVSRVGIVTCWGGRNGCKTDAGVCRSQPTAVLGDGLTNVVELGERSLRGSFARTARGMIWAWSSAESPHHLEGPSDVVQLASGFGHLCVLRTSGTVSCLGSNQSLMGFPLQDTGPAGQLGDGTWTDHHSFAAVVNLSEAVSIAAGGSHSCALLANARAKCWGENRQGELGDGTLESKNRPVDVVDLKDVTSLAAGFAHTCAILSDKTVRCWGLNSKGQLGDGTRLARSRPMPVPGLRDVLQISAGYQHTCAVLGNGTAHCWGEVQQGPGDTSDQLTATLVPGLREVTELSASWYHTCARTADGALYCWGSNSTGQLGDGTTNDTRDPVKVLVYP